MQNFLITFILFLPRILAFTLTALVKTPINNTIRTCFAVFMTYTATQINLKGELDISVKYIMTEIIIGIFLATIINILFTMADLYGSLSASLSSLSNNIVTGGIQHSQENTILTNFYNNLLHIILFNTYLKYIARGLFKSFEIIPLGMLKEELAIKTIVHTLYLVFFNSLKIMAPVFILSISIYIISGTIGKILPRINLFFVIQPLQLIMILHIVSLTLAYVVQNMICAIIEYYV